MVFPLLIMLLQLCLMLLQAHNIEQYCENGRNKQLTNDICDSSHCLEASVIKQTHLNQAHLINQTHLIRHT